MHETILKDELCFQKGLVKSFLRCKSATNNAFQLISASDFDRFSMLRIINRSRHHEQERHHQYSFSPIGMKYIQVMYCITQRY